MKLIKRMAIGLVLVILIGGIVVYLRINGIVKAVVENQGTSQLKVPTTLGSANVDLWGGSVGLYDLNIGSPQGFSAPTMFAMGGVKVQARLGELRQDPVSISTIVIDKPKLVIEQKNGQFNFKALLDQLPKGEAANPPQEPPAGEKPVKLIIRELRVNDATVTIRLGVPIPGVDKIEYTIAVPSLILREIGNDDSARNGAAIKDVITQTLRGLVASAAEAREVPEPVRLLLRGDLNNIGEQLKSRATEELKKAVPGEAGKLLGGGEGKDRKDPGKAAAEGLANLLGDPKKDEPKK